MSEHSHPVVSATDATPTSDLTTAESIRSVTSAELLQGQSELRIVHRNKIYRLCVTNNGRLILVK